MFLEHRHYVYVAGVILYNVHIVHISNIYANFVKFPGLNEEHLFMVILGCQDRIDPSVWPTS
jgi:hypothetical protein